jgi:hypothetical protein
LIAPTVTVWQPPVDASVTFNYYACRQIQDANSVNDQQPEIPYAFLKAYSDALSVELAMIYAPEKLAVLQQAAAVSYKRAKDMNAERVPWFITPGLGAYYR